MISRKVLFILSVPLIVLVATCSLWGLLTPDFYSRETLNWQAQSIGQDLVDLFVIMPALIITTIFAALKKKSGYLVWGGVLLYLIYTFTIYCFSVHFNSLFLLYCLILGIAFYSFLYLMYTYIKTRSVPVLIESGYIRFVGAYFIVVSFLFYLLWLSDILPSIQSGVVPTGLQDSGLFTNPVHIIDLAIFLPGLFISGLLILKRNSIGFLFIPVMLVFFILMDVTIAVLVLIMKQRGIEADLSVAVGMCVLALFSLVLLIGYLKKIKISAS